MAKKEEAVEKKEVEQTTQSQGIGLKEATIEQLKAGAFDIDQQFKVLQANYGTIMEELKLRLNKEV